MTINGIPRVDPRARPGGWKRAMQRVVATKPGAAIHRTIAARLDTPIMKATGGRVTLAVGAVPVVVLTTTGARSGQRREKPLVYFTDGDDVILTASNYGGARHPGWYHNLLAHPECELHLLRAQRRSSQPWLIFAYVVAGAVFIEGQFACHYFVICTVWPGSFAPPILTRIDAAYFTITTATTTGMGDIHPASSYARLIVSAQMVFSFILLVIAIGTALQRGLARADR